jgi:hypothetical protein
MKVNELKLGMIVQPAGDNEVFLIRPPMTWERYGYISVRSKPRANMGAVSRTNRALYLGDREDSNVSKRECGYSNRFVLLDGTILGIDPGAWQRMKPASL